MTACLPFPILYEDSHCLAVNKPAGLLTTHYQGKEETLDRLVKGYVKEKYNKPGNVFLGVVHRLDRPVSGVVLFARTSKAAARLAEQFRLRTIVKIYWAIVEGRPARASARLEDWLRKDRATRIVEVAFPQAPEASQAILNMVTHRARNDMSWLEIRPLTGRGHQIRVQLAHRGNAIVGDAKYGAVTRFGGAIALHARSLSFVHPVRREPITLTADLPIGWRQRFASLLREGLQ
jgi:23S rRNA pseudouridine1911/1915/1917 synthase